ncbi:hypothetical protein CON64_09945 [Bacillus pseudomycoides]|nr:hypothetical protein CON64_09945 [Bacillus pseudomycoides]
MNWKSRYELLRIFATDSKPINTSVSALKIVKATANSEESGQNPANNVIDGNPDTIWHTKWNAQNQHL